MSKELTNFERYLKQESLYQLDRFTREEALQLGLIVNRLAQQYPDPVAIEITVNGLVVFRFFPDGTIPDSELWLRRKRNAVELMHMSSLRFGAWLEENGETLESRKIDATQYAACGGGFPLILRGTGVIGSLCVSGLPNHEDDHQLVVDALAEYLASK